MPFDRESYGPKFGLVLVPNIKAGVLSLCLLCSMELFAAKAVTYYLLSIEQIGAPIVKNRQLIYKTDVKFVDAPDNYWIHYDEKKEALIIDVYDATIVADSSLKLRDNELFSGVRIKNRETSMSLSGEEALILLDCDRGWHFESEVVNSTAIRITAWKKLSIPRAEEKKDYRIIWYILAALLASSASFALITFIGHANR